MELISVQKAQRVILKNCRVLRKVRRPILEALGHVLAQDVRAPFPAPRETNSAMDGFALRASDTQGASARRPVFLKIRGTVRAGDGRKRVLQRGEALRIMTGAVIPRGGDRVLPQEYAVALNGRLCIDKALKPGTHVRSKGEEVKRGALVLKSQSLIRPGTAGILASFGLKAVTVFARPRVSIVTTGSELAAPGRPLKNGKIYDSNSAMIAAALCEMGIKSDFTVRVPDGARGLRSALRKAIGLSDVVILTGGVSVGKFDFVRQVLGGLGVRTLFAKVRQKPGKPFVFARKGRKVIFGLPGNPASAFTCLYEYVYPAIRKLSGHERPLLPSARARLEDRVKPDPRRLLFLKGRLGQNGRKDMVWVLKHQGSHMITALKDTDALVRIPPAVTGIRRGGWVQVDLLPGEFKESR